MILEVDIVDETPLSVEFDDGDDLSIHFSDVEIVDEAPLSVEFDDDEAPLSVEFDDSDNLNVHFDEVQIVDGVSDVRVNRVSVVRDGVAYINNIASEESLLEHTRNSDIHVTAAFKMVISDSEIENL